MDYEQDEQEEQYEEVQAKPHVAEPLELIRLKCVNHHPKRWND